MRLLFTMICVLALAKTYSQQPIPQDSTSVEIEKVTPVDAVKTFFKNFHAQDTTALKESMLVDITLTSLAIKGDNRKISTMVVNDFIKSIASIPDSVAFEERLIEISYSNDTQIATVTTTYEFYYNKFLSHIGTNVFTLYYIDDKWVIAGLADTRIYGS